MIFLEKTFVYTLASIFVAFTRRSRSNYVDESREEVMREIKLFPFDELTALRLQKDANL